MPKEILLVDDPSMDNNTPILKLLLQYILFRPTVYSADKGTRIINDHRHASNRNGSGVAELKFGNDVVIDLWWLIIERKVVEGVYVISMCCQDI